MLKVTEMELKTKMGRNGRVVVPVEFRRRLNLQPGDELVVRLEENQLSLIPLRYALAQAQKIVRQYVPEEVSLVEALLEDRRAEADRE